MDVHLAVLAPSPRQAGEVTLVLQQKGQFTCTAETPIRTVLITPA